MRRSIFVVCAAALGIGGSSAAFADTTNYTYDALGRVVGSDVDRGYHVTTTIGYDPAGNRSTYVVSGASGGQSMMRSVPTTSRASGESAASNSSSAATPASEAVIYPYLLQIGGPVAPGTGN